MATNQQWTVKYSRSQKQTVTTDRKIGGDKMDHQGDKMAAKWVTNSPRNAKHILSIRRTDETGGWR